MQRLLGRALFILLILLTLPAFAAGATYWAITASTTPAALKSNLSPARPANFGNYTTPNGGSLTNVIRTPYSSVDYVVNIPVGYTLTNVKVDGVVKGSTAGTYTVDKGTLASHTIVANYVAASYIITATSVAGGSITSSLTAPAGTSPTITVTPYTGNQLTGVIIDTTTYALADQLPSFVSKTGGATGATYTFLSISAAHAIKGVFSTIPTATAIISTPSQTLATGATGIAIDGSASTSSDPGTAYGWTASCGSVTATGPNAKTATYTAPATTGSCTVTLTVSASGTNPKQANVTFTIASQVLAATNNCLACHDGTNGPAVPGFTSSPHYGVKSCADCHNPGNSLTHPYAPVASMANICRSCHTDAQGNVPNHPVDIGTNTCSSCHNAHTTAATVASIKAAPHYNNITTGMFPASYVTSQASCADCHISGSVNSTIRQQWYTSGHARVKAAPWTNYDFKTMSGCVQCHTTTGFIAYSTGKVTAAWGVASDKTKEVLTCKGCHSNITTGSVRSVAPVSPYADDSYVNPNVGMSNICMDCHSGTKNGASITAKLDAHADFTNMSLVVPHYLAAGGTLYGRAGYHFSGRTYNSEATHRNVGSLDASGPCISCHKNSTFGHTFKPGVIPLCSNCHGAAFSAAQLDADQVFFANALEVLRAQLEANGFVYKPTYPFFSNVNWGSGQAGANTMGAAFNYVLLLSEPGAYAHDPAYAKQLILDSIDYLDNGQFDDSVATLAVPNLRDSGRISPEVAASLLSYKAKNLCTTCHGGTAATAEPMATNAHLTHLTGACGPGFFLGSDSSSCQACHLYSSATHMNGSVDTIAGGGSACQGCHAGAVPSWTSASRLDCTTCHAATPAVLPNGVAAPFKANFFTTGHGRFAASNQCTVCHDPDSRHISGSLGSYTRLRLLNDNNLCASCHDDAGKVGVDFRNMVTHRDLACIACHDTHGTTNPAMLHSSINSATITITDLSAGLIDATTNRGLCQVCHTTTNHYRAGVPESNHYTSGCLGCHPHKSAEGAFQPAGGGSCDSCHGYPPAPRNPAVAFGTTGAWVNARFEDYSGGGGAHLVAQHVSPNAKPSEGWVNCTVCHNGGNLVNAPYHKMITPVATHISNVHIQVDLNYQFSEGFTIYTGARLVDAPARNETGSCFNISCHMTASPRWSIER
jgi:trimeric autotransporter adhesin